MGSLELDRCPACDGLWFDHDELQAYVGAAGQPTALDHGGGLAPVGEALLPCPRCHTSSLRSFRLDRLYLSRCLTYAGVYLDGADVRALLDSTGASAHLHSAEESIPRTVARDETALFIVEAVLEALDSAG